MGKIKHQLNRKHNQKIFPTHPLLRQVSCTEVSIYMYIHCCSLTQSRPTLCDPMNFSTPGLTVPHYLPKFAQVHVHCISDAIQPSHPLMPSPSALSLSQHQHPMSQLFASDDQNTGVSASASILPKSIWGWFPSRLTDLISLPSKGLSGVFSSTTVWSHQFFVFMVQVSQLYVTTGKTIALTTNLCWQSDVSAFQHTV